MKRVLAISFLVLGLAACSSSSGLSSQAQKVVPIVKKCLVNGSLTTQSGRKAVLHCIAPPGHEVAFERCAISVLTVSNVTIHHKRLYEGLATCLENNR